MPETKNAVEKKKKPEAAENLFSRLFPELSAAAAGLAIEVEGPRRGEGKAGRRMPRDKFDKLVPTGNLRKSAETIRRELGQDDADNLLNAAREFDERINDFLRRLDRLEKAMAAERTLRCGTVAPAPAAEVNDRDRLLRALAKMSADELRKLSGPA